MERDRSKKPHLTPAPRSLSRPVAEPSGELALLRHIRSRVSAANLSLTLGIGDDCALIRVRPGEEIAVTTDLSIAGRHFNLAWHPPQAIGHRVLARGLSDLAAMGARPVAAFLSLGVPANLVQKVKGIRWVDRFYDGLLALAAKHKVPLAGGDLAQSPIAAADIVLLGAVRRGKALLRSGARPGDLIYVTGNLGAAATGFAKLKALARSRRPTGHSGLTVPPTLKEVLERQLYPHPRIAQGLRLIGRATAAIDLSDGLSTDLAHLCQESGVAAEIDASGLPISEGATLDQALHGGEDYELLFTASPTTRIPGAIAGVQVTQIGAVTKCPARGPAVTLATPHGRRPLEPNGWQHFA